MPAVVFFRHITSKPLAGDDLQIVCFVLGACRLIQLMCIIPLAIKLLAEIFNGKALVVDKYYAWCPQWQEAFDNENSSVVVIAVDKLNDGLEITQDHFMSSFIIMASVYTALNYAWILALWGVTSIGTPTQPMGRDGYLRSLIVIKMFTNIFPIAGIVIGCIRIHWLRQANYHCGDRTPVYYPDKSWMYVLFCVLLVTYALEILPLPACVMRRAMRWIRGNELTRINRYATEAKGERLEQYLGGLLKCLSIALPGGKELRNQGEMKDFAVNLMEFLNNETKTGIVFSDMYVGLKLLARVQAERRFLAIQTLQSSSNERALDEREKNSVEAGGSGGPLSMSRAAAVGRSGKGQPSPEVMEEDEEYAEFLHILGMEGKRLLLETSRVRGQRSILALQTDGDGKGYMVVEKHILSSSNSKDADVLRNASRYSYYARHIYHNVRIVLEDFLPKNATKFNRGFEMTGPIESLSLAKLSMPYAHLFYANFHNGIRATPYAILVDEEYKAIVIAVRGTISLEDWVTDLQYVPQPLDDVGKICGFDGTRHHCHKGVLARCKWLYNDIKRQKMLRHLFSSDSMYKECNLVVVGHSLGGGCAQVLSLMLRPSFPSLKCYAFEPPGCIFDDVLCEHCKEWITSVVKHNDVVPRLTQPNLESLRDEFFDVLARIKVSKWKAFHDIRAPCPKSHLALRNAKILRPKGQIDRDTVFFQQVQKFRNERAAKNQRSEVAVKLYIPGQIIYLVDTLGDESKYVPYYASRYEFNQVVLSGRMLADHSMPPLVDTLRKLNLNDVHEVRTWHVDDDEESEDEDAEDVPVCLPFSNPQGKVPLVLIALALIACFMAWWSNQGCKFVTRSGVTTYGGTSSPLLVTSAGLWTYNLKKCIDGDNCNVKDPNDLEESKFCQQYPQIGAVDIYWESAKIFGILAILLGFISAALISTATCTKIKKRTWKMLVAVLLLVTLFQGLQFLLFKSDLCNTWINPKTGWESSSECSLSTGGRVGIVATVFWFFTAVGCSHMARLA